MSEIKSLKDLNPINSPEPDNQANEVNNENVSAVENTADNSTVNEDVTIAADTVSTTENNEDTASNTEKYEYIMPGEDTTFGSGFDFAASINRRREFITNRVNQLKEQQAEEEIEKEIGEVSSAEENTNIDFNINDDLADAEEDDSVPVSTANTTKKANTEKPNVKITAPEPGKEVTSARSSEPVKISSNDLPSQSDIFIDEEDFDDLEEDTTDDFTENDLNELKAAITSKLSGIDKTIDVAGFTIAKEAISVNSIFLDTDDTGEIFDWPLMSAGKLISMKTFSGAEIENLNGSNARNRLNSLRDIYLELYNHIVDPNKPEFEVWLKTTSFMDISHLFMAAYKASFHDANYIPFTCTNPKCGHIFLSDNIDILNMVKFKDDDAKRKFYNIMENGTISSSKLYETKIVPINNRFAIGFREPSIYNTIFENAVLDQKFIEKYQKLLSLMVYIDAIYVIKDNQFVPIALKEYKDNLAKTTKYKIATYAKVINRLSSDSYNKILSIIASINELGDEVTYQLPEVTCPKCSHTIEAEERDSTQLLFSRHQLALIANS